MPVQIHQFTHQNLEVQHRGEDNIDNYEYERDSNHHLDYEYDEQSDNENHQMQTMLAEGQAVRQVPVSIPQHLIMQGVTNQDFHESPISQRIHHQVTNQLQLNQQASQNWPQQLPLLNQNSSAGQPRFDVNVVTYLDTLFEVCLYKNGYEKNTFDKLKDQISLELYFEKLSLLQQTLKYLNQNYILLFQRFLNKEGFKEAIIKVFTNDRSTINAFDILDELSNFYMKNCAQKNIYEHPFTILSHGIEQQQFIRSNNNQTSQSSGHQQLYHNPLNSNPGRLGGGGSSRNSFISNTNNNHNISGNLPLQFRNQIHHSQHQSNIMLASGPMQQQIRQQHPFQVEDDLMIDHINDENIQDFVDIINKERLIIIQIHSIFIKASIESFSQKNDAYLQFHTLNALDNLYSNLMPVPNYQNLIVKQMLQRQRGAFNQNDMMGVIGQQQNFQAKVHHHEIPDLEKFLIVDNLQQYQQLLHQQSQVSSQQQVNIILSEFESTDPKYLHGRLAFGLKIWNYIETSLLQSCWSNIKSICYGVLCQILRIDISEYKTSLQNKVKNLLFPMLNNLLFSKESESKAGGLNILGSFCGLGQDFANLSQHIKLSENLQYFRKNSPFVSLVLWQQVFNLQEDYDPAIREAASVLIQVCAPRESVKHFYNLVQEKYQLKLQSVMKTFNAGANVNLRFKQYVGGQSQCQTPLPHGESHLEPTASTPLNQRQSLMNAYVQNIQSARGAIGSSMAVSHTDFMAPGTASDNEEEKISDKSSNDEDGHGHSLHQADDGFEDYFYIDTYNEHQLKEIASIFKNDYKPPKNLWIEKNGITNFQSAGGQITNTYEGAADIQDQNLVDTFEDRIVDKLNKMQGNKGSESSSISLAIDSFLKKSDGQSSTNASGNGNGESEYLIFERHFESDKEKLGTQQVPAINESKKTSQDNNAAESLNQDDLGIIDLDDDEGGDEFDELDDDKLPVLKNTYSKKNRPNNSKSVAIGSRTQEMHARQKIMGQKQSDLLPVKPIQTVDKEPKVAEIQLPVQQDQKSEPRNQDQIIEEYENMISQTIKDLNSQLRHQEIKSPTSVKQEKSRISEDLIKSPPIQPTHSQLAAQLRKRQDEQRKSQKQKQNKSFDIKQQRKVGSPIKKAPEVRHDAMIKSIGNINLTDINIELDRQSSQNSTGQQLFGFNSVKKINDPLIQQSKKTYASQGSKQARNSGISKKEQQLKQAILANTSPAQSHNSTFNNSQISQQLAQTQKQISGKQNHSAILSNQRKKKSDGQRKSDVPPTYYQSLGQKRSQVPSNNASQVQSSSNLHLQVATHLSNLPPQLKGSQTTLIQQAKQAFVSRAKSQSYLNNLFGSTSSISHQQKSGDKQRKSLKQTSQSFSHNYTKPSMKGRVFGSLKPDESSSGSQVNSACSGGLVNTLAQLHKGYFSNDECEPVTLIASKNKTIRNLISPPRSGDLKQKSKQQSFSSDEQDMRQLRAHSHNLQRKNNKLKQPEEEEVKVQVKTQEDEMHLRLERPKRKFKRFISKDSPNTQPNQTIGGSHMLEEYAEYQQEELGQPMLNNFLDEDDCEEVELIYREDMDGEDLHQEEPDLIQNLEEEEDIGDQDVEEFNSAEEGSARGTGTMNVKQLSCIDEEDDQFERKTVGMSSVKGGVMDNYSMSSGVSQ